MWTGGNISSHPHSACASMGNATRAITKSNFEPIGVSLPRLAEWWVGLGLRRFPEDLAVLVEEDKGGSGPLFHSARASCFKLGIPEYRTGLPRVCVHEFDRGTVLT